MALTKDSLRIYSSKNGRLQKYIDLSDKDLNELTCLAANQQQKQIYVGNTLGSVSVCNAVTFQHINTLQCLDKHISSLVHLHLCSNDFLATVTASDTIRVMSTSELTDVKVSHAPETLK